MKSINILKNSLALSLIGTMAYGAYLLAHLKPPITQGLTVIGGNYLVNGTAKELINETCGDYVGEIKPYIRPKTLNFGSGLYSSITSVMGSKKPTKAKITVKKNSKEKSEREGKECVEKVPYRTTLA